MKTAILSWCIAVIMVSAAFSQTPARVAPEDFAILPWSQIGNDAKVLEGVRECGFNLAGMVAPESLDAVQAAGLKAIVSHGPLHVNDTGFDEAEYRRNARAILDRVGKHSAVFGYYLRDEPSAKVFPSLAKAVSILHELSPGVRSYINLFPNYASPEQLGTATYEEHLEQFAAMVKPPFISYDHYALMEGGGLRPQYFANLEAVRKASLAHKLPFWNIVLGNAHFNYAEPSEAGLSFQVFTTLAYGGRGISYYTYLTPAHGNYRLAAIDQFGHRTATWDLLRRVNLQVHVLAPTLVKLTSVHVFHHPDVPQGCQGIATSRFVAELSGRALIVGEFEDAQHTPWAMIVNKDLQKSTPVAVKFKKPGPLISVNSYTGGTAVWDGEGLWLAPGQGALVQLQTK